MKKILLIIGMMLLIGCSSTPEPSNTTNLTVEWDEIDLVETMPLDKGLQESDLIRSMQFQIKLQDSVIVQLHNELAKHVKILEGFETLNQQQEEINRQTLKAITLLANRR